MRGAVLFFAGVGFLAPAARADHADFVVVNANASKAYTDQKFVNGVPKPETYVFYQGKYFGGDTYDRSLSRATFMDIAKVLAPSLAKHSYYPTRDVKATDLVIVVNWGTTMTDYGGKSVPESQFQFQQELADIQSYNATIEAGGIADPSPITFDLMIDQANAMSAEKVAESNAGLLGYSNEINKEEEGEWASPDGLNSSAESHLADLNEERYFVILLAYDYQKMVNAGKAGDRQPRPVWSVRMNIRAAGNNFTEALPAMSKVAADYFGRQLDNLMSTQTDVGKNSKVEVGPVKILDDIVIVK
jgi:hypothetical protein